MGAAQKHQHEPYKVFFETLGNKTRWEIVHLLQKSPHRSTDIAEQLGYEQSLVSHHLKRLATCGFVKVEANSTERIYHINEKTIGPLLKLVDKHVNRYCSKFCLPRSKA